MKRLILGSTLLTSLISMLLISCLIYIVLYGQIYNDMKRTLEMETGLIREGYALSGEEYLDRLQAQAHSWRITLIAPDGTVLYDNNADPATMENHLNRPEVQEALKTGTGQAVRTSATIGHQTFYQAVKLGDGSVLRAAKTTDIVYATIIACIPYTLLAIAAVAVLSGFVAGWRTKRIIRPINLINLDDPLQNDVYAELSPLLTRIEQQHRKIGAQMEELQKKQDEFSALTGNMSEGLILLNQRGTVLSINKSAARLYGTGRDYVGKDILVVDRSQPIQDIVREALSGQHAEATVEIAGRTYSFMANPVISSEQIRGALLLSFDVTERIQAEKMRREFTANVSHELKTPLQSIIGSAELIKSGMVREEDLPRFAGRIYDEASHLVGLIGDIIRLSQIDELRQETPREAVELTSLCQEAAERLKDLAVKHEVTIAVVGETAVIQGVRQLLYEIAYNLIENAVKYNKRGGSVTVRIQADAASAMLSVADTGIGIPKEDQSRIFERFYRVDKSHSRETGGTGLGLSIVKHAAQFHGAVITLDSRVGSGTTVTVRFPIKQA